MKKFVVTVNGTAYDVEVNEVGSVATAPVVVAAPVVAAPAPVAAPAAAPAPAAEPVAAPKADAPIPEGASTVTSPMPGKILSVSVKEGDAVKDGDVLCVLEAMKMQNEIYASCDATVKDVRVVANQTVSTGDVLIVLG